MRLLPYLLTGLAATTLWTACGPKTSEEENTETAAATPQYPIEKDGLTLSVLQASPAFDDAKLALKSAKPDEKDAFTFDFEVQNYALGAQTEAQPAGLIANSPMGQHLHFIVDNAPYSAHTETRITQPLTPGNHVILAFPSRSYHESLKNPNAYVLTQYKVGEGNAEQVDLTRPHLFYSRPKGAYIGKDTERILLDFYLVNTHLSPDGHSVRATINGTEFLFTEWLPYVVEGLPLGEVTFKLELLDASGNLVPSHFNPVERMITLEAEKQAGEA